MNLWCPSGFSTCSLPSPGPLYFVNLVLTCSSSSAANIVSAYCKFFRASSCSSTHRDMSFLLTPFFICARCLSVISFTLCCLSPLLILLPRGSPNLMAVLALDMCRYAVVRRLAYLRLDSPLLLLRPMLSVSSRLLTAALGRRSRPNLVCTSHHPCRVRLLRPTLHLWKEILRGSYLGQAAYWRC